MAREPRLDAPVILYHLWSIELSDGQFLLMTGTKMSLFTVYKKFPACQLGQSSRVLAEDPGASSRDVYAAYSGVERSRGFDREALEK